MATTSIEWSETVWNPTTGCDRVSPGYDLCYALTLAKRLKAMGSAKYQRDGDPRTSGPGFGVTEHPDALSLPLRWRKPRRVFVNSMSDLFHPRISGAFIARVFAVMAQTPQHTYQILTKRAPRMAALVGGDGLRLLERAWTTDEPTALALSGPWPLPNVHLGVSVEDQQRADERIPRLFQIPAAVRWVSAEPLLGPVDLTPWLHDSSCVLRAEDVCTCSEPREERLDWVVVGGESGPGARPMEPAWAQSIVDQCRAAGVAVFVKQLGTALGGKAHHDIDTFPPGLRVREYPEVAE